MEIWGLQQRTIRAAVTIQKGSVIRMPVFHTIHVKKIKKLIVFLLIPLAVGGLAALLTRSGMDYYKTLVTPPLAPPGFVFPIAWTILYILMGLASYLVYTRGTDRAQVNDALRFYAIQLALNFIWTLVFFNLRSTLFAFLILVVLWIFIGITAAKFYRVNHCAGYLMLPYWAWVTFAGYLNLAIWILNR